MTQAVSPLETPVPPRATQGLDILLAGPEEMEECLAVRRQAYLPLGKLTIETVSDDFDHSCVHFLIREEGIPVASARMNLTDSFELERHFDTRTFRTQGRCAEINRLSLLPSKQGTGTSKQMFRALFRYAKTKGVDYFLIVACPGREAQLYEKLLGFQKVAGPLFYEELRTEHVFMALEINKQYERFAYTNPGMHSLLGTPIPGIDAIR